MTNGERPVHVGGTILGLLDLGSIRKLAEKTVRSKSLSNTPPWPLCEFLPSSSCSV